MHILVLPLGVFFLSTDIQPVPTGPFKEVWVFENLGYRNAELPFVRSGPEYIPEVQVPSSDVLHRIAAEEGAVIEVCTPRDNPDFRSRTERQRDCRAYGESVETRRQP